MSDNTHKLWDFEIERRSTLGTETSPVKLYVTTKSQYQNMFQGRVGTRTIRCDKLPGAIVPAVIVKDNNTSLQGVIINEIDPEIPTVHTYMTNAYVIHGYEACCTPPTNGWGEFVKPVMDTVCLNIANNYLKRREKPLMYQNEVITKLALPKQIMENLTANCEEGGNEDCIDKICSIANIPKQDAVVFLMCTSKSLHALMNGKIALTINSKLHDSIYEDGGPDTYACFEGWDYTLNTIPESNAIYLKNETASLLAFLELILYAIKSDFIYLDTIDTIMSDLTPTGVTFGDETPDCIANFIRSKKKEQPNRKATADQIFKHKEEVWEEIVPLTNLISNMICENSVVEKFAVNRKDFQPLCDASDEIDYINAQLSPMIYALLACSYSSVVDYNSKLIDEEIIRSRNFKKKTYGKNGNDNTNEYARQPMATPNEMFLTKKFHKTPNVEDIFAKAFGCNVHLMSNASMILDKLEKNVTDKNRNNLLFFMNKKLCTQCIQKTGSIPCDNLSNIKSWFKSNSKIFSSTTCPCMVLPKTIIREMTTITPSDTGTLSLYMLKQGYLSPTCMLERGPYNPSTEKDVTEFAKSGYKMLQNMWDTDDELNTVKETLEGVYTSKFGGFIEHKHTYHGSVQESMIEGKVMGKTDSKNILNNLNSLNTMVDKVVLITNQLLNDINAANKSNEEQKNKTTMQHVAVAVPSPHSYAYYGCVPMHMGRMSILSTSTTLTSNKLGKILLGSGNRNSCVSQQKNTFYTNHLLDDKNSPLHLKIDNIYAYKYRICNNPGEIQTSDKNKSVDLLCCKKLKLKAFARNKNFTKNINADGGQQAEDDYDSYVSSKNRSKTKLKFKEYVQKHKKQNDTEHSEEIDKDYDKTIKSPDETLQGTVEPVNKLDLLSKISHLTDMDLILKHKLFTETQIDQRLVTVLEIFTGEQSLVIKKSSPTQRVTTLQEYVINLEEVFNVTLSMNSIFALFKLQQAFTSLTSHHTMGKCLINTFELMEYLLNVMIEANLYRVCSDEFKDTTARQVIPFLVSADKNKMTGDVTGWKPVVTVPLDNYHIFNNDNHVLVMTRVDYKTYSGLGNDSEFFIKLDLAGLRNSDMKLLTSTDKTSGNAVIKTKSLSYQGRNNEIKVMAVRMSNIDPSYKKHNKVNIQLDKSKIEMLQYNVETLFHSFTDDDISNEQVVDCLDNISLDFANYMEQEVSEFYSAREDLNYAIEASIEQLILKYRDDNNAELYSQLSDKMVQACNEVDIKLNADDTNFLDPQDIKGLFEITRDDDIEDNNGCNGDQHEEGEAGEEDNDIILPRGLNKRKITEDDPDKINNKDIVLSKKIRFYTQE